MKKYTTIFTLFLSLLIAVIAFAEDDETIKFYDSYVEATNKAKSLDELKPYLSQNNLNQLKEVSNKDLNILLDLMRDIRKPMKRINISSKIEENKAILTIEAINVDDPNAKITGIITLVRENGQWKIDNEDFTSQTFIE
ncbi:MAG: DUF3828 domain-containing protein [Candidatus Dadabacteria bacterium]|nr:DUF3828 domain-containing protein [Candidatus Dadabacteria bacterium]